MSNTKLSIFIKFIFLPALLLSFLLSCSSSLLYLSQNALIGKQLGFSEIPTLKVLTTIAQILIAISLLVFSIYKPFEKVFKGFLLISIGIIVLLTGLIFFQEDLALSGISESFGIHKPLVIYWHISLMYVVLSVFNASLYSLFIWGFINRLTSLSEGMKYYIPLTILLPGAISSLGRMVPGVYQWSLIAMVIPAIVFMVFSLFIFNWAWKRLPNHLMHPQEPSVSKTRFPYLSAAYLLAGSSMIGSFLAIFFKSELKNQFKDGASYAKFMGAHSMSVGFATFAISIIWAVLGTWLILKKGWKVAALYASLSILIGGMIFLCFSPSWLGWGIFKGLLASHLFFPLIQILYLYQPYQNRFKTKIVTEMISLPLMKAVPLFATQGLLVFFGSIAAITIYLKIFVSVLLVLIVIASYRTAIKTY